MKQIATKRDVRWDADVKYRIWYCPQLPLKLLRYRDLEALDPLGNGWRKALLEDVKQRGLVCPLLVLNHQHTDPELKLLLPKPYFLRVGRNRRWAIEKLGWTHAPCIVTGECEYECTEITTPEQLKAVWTDGRLHVSKAMIYVYEKTDAARYEAPAA